MVNFIDGYEKNLKKFLWIPAILVVLSLVFIFSHFNATGDIVDRDVSLKGGVSATIETDQVVDSNKLESILAATFGDADVRSLAEFGTDKQIGIIVEISETKEEELRSILESELNLELGIDNYSTEVVGSSLGEAFYQQLLVAILFAFLFMGVVVFITFRSFVPSLAVVLAALFDIICTLALINLFGIKISTAGIAAILLLIGYSIDTDILLTTRVLKRKEGKIMDRVVGAMKTGLTMTITTVVALGAGFFVSSSLILKEMFLIIILGLILDVIMTYAMNAPLLVLYTKKKESQ